MKAPTFSGIVSAVAVAICGLYPAPAPAQAYSDLFIFGDSMPTLET